MDRWRLANTVRRQAGVISTAQLLACGLSSTGISRWVSVGRLFRVRRTVYSMSPHVEEWGHMWAAVLGTDADHAVLSHWSAGRIHGFCSGPGPIHVTVRGPGRRRLPGLVVHRSRGLDPQDVVVVRGLRVTSPARTVLDAAASTTDADVRRMIREGEFHGVLGAGEIRDAVAGRTGHRGLARVRRVDPATAEAALGQTPLEDELDPLLVALAIPGLERQYWLAGLSGKRYRPDFAYPAVRLAIEADGRSAHQRSLGFEVDRAREADLGAVGWQVLRFTRLRVHHDPGTVQRSTRETVRVRSRDLGSPGLAA
jgi:hypothetical protein